MRTDPHGEVAKPLPVVRLPIHNLLVFVDNVVGLELLTMILADKEMAPVLPNFVLVRCWQRFERLITDITWVNHLFLVLCPPPWSRPATTGISSQTQNGLMQVHPGVCVFTKT